MKECCQTCKLRYEAHQTDFRKLGTDEHIDSIIDDAFICMAFAYEGIANLMIGTDPNLGLCEVYTPKTEQTEPKRGEWERVKNADNGYDFRCTACRRYRFHNGEMRKKYNFCPNCGADMRKESE